jgi:hypothetical protein
MARPIDRSLHGLALAYALACVAALVACSYDSDQPCGKDRELRDGLCHCKGDDIDRDGECIAPAPLKGGLADECNEDDKPCESEKYDTCHLVSEDRGYCTSSGCSTEADCEQGWFCVTDADPSYCKREPTGQGAACSSEDGCAEFDANFCVMASFGAFCVERDCTEASCSPGYVCQDFSAVIPGVPLICAPEF